MVPNGSAYANYPSFANNGAKTPPGGSPESAKYALGMVPADTFPAEWANWLFHGATAGITRLNTDVGSIKKEINSVLAAYNVTPDATVYNQLYTAIEKRLTALKNTVDGEIGDSAQSVTQLFRSELSSAINTLSQSITQAYEARVQSLYPVGTIYQNRTDSTNPGTLFGFGTWAPISDAFLAARGSTYIGANGGNRIVAFSVTGDNLPLHSHSIDIQTSSALTGITASHQHAHPILGSDGGSALGPAYAYQWGDSGRLVEGMGNWAIAQSFRSIQVQNLPEGQQYVTIADPGHTHFINGATGGSGGSSPINIEVTPPYIGVYTWQRTA